MKDSRDREVYIVISGTQKMKESLLNNNEAYNENARYKMKAVIYRNLYFIYL